MTNQVKIIVDPAVRGRAVLLSELQVELGERTDSTAWPRRALVEISNTRQGDAEGISLFKASRGEGFDVHLFIEVAPERTLTASWLLSQLEVGLNAYSDRAKYEATERSGDLRVLFRGEGSPSEPIVVRLSVMIVRPPMPFVWTMVGLGETTAELALRSWWAASGVTQLQVELYEVRREPRVRVRLARGSCVVKVPTPLPGAGASDRQAMEMALSAFHRGLEAGGARVGLAEPPPMPGLDALIAYVAPKLGRDPAAFG
jgi:hypothetical protein